VFDPKNDIGMNTKDKLAKLRFEMLHNEYLDIGTF